MFCLETDIAGFACLQSLPLILNINFSVSSHESLLKVGEYECFVDYGTSLTYQSTTHAEVVPNVH